MWEDFDGKQLHVRRRLYRGDIAEPKSRHGVRAIPLRKATTQALCWLHRDLLERRRAADLRLRGGHAGSTTRTCITAYCKPAMRAAGIEHGGWHLLRHTAATRLVEAGARPDQAQRWLGHHDLAFTMRTYVHPAEDDLPDPDVVWAEPRHPHTSARETTADSGSRVGEVA